MGGTDAAAHAATSAGRSQQCAYRQSASHHQLAKRLWVHNATVAGASRAQVDGSWRVKVADFNVSKIVEGSAAVTSSLAVHNPRSEMDKHTGLVAGARA